MDHVRIERRDQHLLDVGERNASSVIGPSRTIGAPRPPRRNATTKVVISK